MAHPHLPETDATFLSGSREHFPIRPLRGLPVPLHRIASENLPPFSKAFPASESQKGRYTSGRIAPLPPHFSSFPSQKGREPHHWQSYPLGTIAAFPWPAQHWYHNRPRCLPPLSMRAPSDSCFLSCRRRRSVRKHKFYCPAYLVSFVKCRIHWLHVR